LSDALGELVTIDPDGPFSLELARGFGFGPRAADAAPGEPLRLAFPLDDFSEHAAALARQAEVDGPVEVEVVAGDPQSVVRQVSRILALDRSGAEWAAVGERDEVIGRLQREHHWLRPVLFHSPYEAAAWAAISQRRHPNQARAVRSRLARELGEVFELAGEEVESFPLPEELCRLEGFESLEGLRLERLRAIAQAALDGKLDAERLRAMDPDEAMTELQELPGIGPFYAMLIVVRAAGVSDALATEEPIVRAYAGHFYGGGEPLNGEGLAGIAENWRPYRTWATVLLRYAGDKEGLPRPRRRR
jgi:DNA-3-methyladenine glycosylase II